MLAINFDNWYVRYGTFTTPTAQLCSGGLDFHLQLAKPALKMNNYTHTKEDVP